MKKVLLTATVQSHIAQFHKPLIEMLHEMNFEVHVAAKNNLAEKNGLTLETPDKIFELPFERFPFKINNIKAYFRLKEILRQEKYDVVHCNTPMGAIITRLAARDARALGAKIIYTAHGFHFYKGASIMNWLIYYSIEKWFSRYTDVLITINTEDYYRAKAKLKIKNIEYIPGVGIDVEKFVNTLVDKTDKRKALNIPVKGFLILSIGELNKNKNHEVIIRAISGLQNPDIHYAICGNGGRKDYLESLAKKMNVNLHLLGYRRDIAEICKISDVFVLPSRREGLPVSVMEAMACGLPLVCSDIRGVRDIIFSSENGFLSNYDDEHMFAKSIKQIIEDNDLKQRMKEKNLNTSLQFDQKNIIINILRIYNNLLKSKND